MQNTQHGPTGHFGFSGQSLYQAAHQALSLDPRIDASDIKIQIEEDVVILSGTVDSRDAQYQAELCVANLPGVSEIRNHLRVARRHGEGMTGRVVGQGLITDTPQ
jgi:hypothetical protein